MILSGLPDCLAPLHNFIKQSVKSPVERNAVPSYIVAVQTMKKPFLIITFHCVTQLFQT